jgi:aryl-alcohol dehydrogenase-like predicted oxidoreductase
MNFRSLGRSGLMVSPLAIGTFNFSNPTTETDSIAMVERAYDAGVNFFDTSNNYNEGQSEIYLGHAIKRLPAPQDRHFKQGAFPDRRQRRPERAEQFARQYHPYL